MAHICPDGRERPIAFASRILSAVESRYSVIHKEALAIYWGVKKFYQYLAGRNFILETDHKPLLTIFGEKKRNTSNGSGEVATVGKTGCDILDQ